MKWLTRIGSSLVLALAVYGGWTLWPMSDPVVNVFYETTFDELPYGVVGFPTFNAKSGMDLIDAGANAVHQITGGTLVLPESASAQTRCRPW